MWASWASAILERFVRVVNTFGVVGGAGRKWIVNGRARKRACWRDQSVSCHCDYVRVCE
jgi:endo-beta-N-acetylglucosaminidase D